MYTRRIAEGLTQHLPDWRVAWAMRYGAPALTKALDALQAQQVRRIVILPLYPQYSTTTTASVQDVVEAWCKRTPQVQVECIQDYAEDQRGSLRWLLRSVGIGKHMAAVRS